MKISGKDEKMAKVLKEETGHPESILSILEKKLTGLGYKFTGQRKTILKALANKRELFDTDNIYLLIKKDDPAIGIATVYRTLELLTRLKLICKISVGIDKSMYMLADDCIKQTSVYLICEKCRSIITNNDCLKSAIKIRLREDAEKNILDNCNLKIGNFQVVFTGLCNKCLE
jgi:Fur family ferric uptake transcriptional regulator